MGKKKNTLGKAVSGKGKKKSEQQKLAEELLKNRVVDEEKDPELKPKRLNVNLDPALYKRFKDRCHQENKKISEVVRELVETYLSI